MGLAFNPSFSFGPKLPFCGLGEVFPSLMRKARDKFINQFGVATFLPEDKKKDEHKNLEAQMITHVVLRYSDLQKKFAQSTLTETRGKFADEIEKANHLEGEEKDIELALINGLMMEYGMERFKELNPGFVPTLANFFESPTMNSAVVVAATPVQTASAGESSTAIPQAASAGDSSKGSSSKGASMNGVETGWEDETGGMGEDLDGHGGYGDKDEEGDKDEDGDDNEDGDDKEEGDDNEEGDDGENRQLRPRFEMSGKQKSAVTTSKRKITTIETSDAPTPKRGRGRPIGSGIKTKKPQRQQQRKRQQQSAAAEESGLNLLHDALMHLVTSAAFKDVLRALPSWWIFQA